MDAPWEFENKGCSCGKEERDKLSLVLFSSADDLF